MNNEKEISDKLIEILNMIQESGDFEKIEITGTTCPIRDMPQFDSQLWITAITILGEELDTAIPDDINIFLSEDGKRHLTIEEIVERVMSTAKKQGAKL
ncbi:MAG: hypothetical protein H0U45_11690 [Tatlockia sp.]|jgi:hypothetical protein|nr:hypothetical protein [Tatlockia sp.]